MRKKIIVGNWKMNKTLQEGLDEFVHIFKLLDRESNITDEMSKWPIIIMAPTYIHLSDTVGFAQGWNVKIAAQNCSSENDGAFTGEISASMLKAVNVDYVIVGHSERRNYFHETNEIIAKKISRALENKLSVICCIGETLQERDSGKEFQIITQQIEECLFHLSVINGHLSVVNATNNGQPSHVVIAYEPVWAIGTGRNATPEQAQEMHHYIRSVISKKFGKEISENISILYGGSCNSKNAQSIFSQPDVDGGLIGGASLNAQEFVKVIKAAL
ncbi:MAG: triose-phosphate isomerase [Bacteroidota bacterium]